MEHEVSCASAASIYAATNGRYLKVTTIAITKEDEWLIHSPGHIKEPALDSDSTSISSGLEITGSQITPKEFFASQEKTNLVVFPALHGTGGEDGRIQKLLEGFDVKYAGSGPKASKLCMDKVKTKKVLEKHNIATVPYAALKSRRVKSLPNRFFTFFEKSQNYLIVKPASLGSSVGVVLAKTPEELYKAMIQAAELDSQILLEEYISGQEIECGVLETQQGEFMASVVGEIKPGNEIYDYDDKYITSSAELVIPAELSEAQSQQIQDLSIKAAQTLEVGGLARVDFFVRSEKIYINEINTMPGFTAISMFPRLFDRAGINLPDLIDRLSAQALLKS